MTQLDLDNLVSKYTHTSGSEVVERLRLIPFESQSHGVAGLASAITELIDIKAGLVSRNARSDLLAYSVEGGLGAMCITCVEKYVTGALVKHGLGSMIYARQFTTRFSGGPPRRPPIHAYNIVDVGNLQLVIDLDADPFLGRNTGVIVAPAVAGIPLYTDGFPYHRRAVDSNGQITYYECCFENDNGKVVRYMEGDVAEAITIAPYHLESGENGCPICLPGGATLYFSFDKCYRVEVDPGEQNEKRWQASYEIALAIVCSVVRERVDQLYQITFSNVQEIGIRRKTEGAVAVQVVSTGNRTIEILVSDQGMLMANEWLSFRPTSSPVMKDFRVRLSATACSPGDIVLPLPPGMV
jgi:hypothetical protein